MKNYNAGVGGRPCGFLSVIPSAKLRSYVHLKMYTRSDGYQPTFEEFNEQDARDLYNTQSLGPPKLVTDTLTHLTWRTHNDLQAAAIDMCMAVYDAVRSESEFNDYFTRYPRPDMKNLINYVVENLVGNYQLYTRILADLRNQDGPINHE